MSRARRRLLVGQWPAGRLCALADDATLVELLIDRPESHSHLGDIRLGRVQRVDKGIDAAFVEIGLPRPALLPLGDHDGRLAEGDTVLVQVVRDGRDGKGARVTGRPVLPGLFLVLDPFHPGVGASRRIAGRAAAEPWLAALRAAARPGEGFILRAAALDASPDSVAREAARLRAAWDEIAAARAAARPPACLRRDDPPLALLRDAGADVAEILVDSRAGADALRARLEALLPELAPRVAYRPSRDWIPSPAEIDEQIEAALEPEVALSGGGSLLIEPGRTLTAIDVNSGGAAGDGGGRRAGERRLLDANLAATVEIARQLRLRNLGGIVVIDFIDLKAPAARTRVVEALRAALADDPAPCRVGEMSRLGLVEMTRRRRGASLLETMSTDCPACAGRGRVPIRVRAEGGGTGAGAGRGGAR